MESFEELKSTLSEKESGEANFIAPFPLLTSNAVESLRYRAEVCLLHLLITIFVLDYYRRNCCF